MTFLDCSPLIAHDSPQSGTVSSTHRYPAWPELARRGWTVLPVLTPLLRDLVEHISIQENLLRVWHDALYPHCARLPEAQRPLYGHALASFCAELLEQLARHAAGVYTTRCGHASGFPDTPLRTARRATRQAQQAQTDAVCAIPGTWQGELACSMALLARLPAGCPTEPVQPLNQTMPFSHVQFAITTLAYGYLHLLAAELAARRSIPNPNRHDTWMTCALQSGAAALLGDQLDNLTRLHGREQGICQLQYQLLDSLRACSQDDWAHGQTRSHAQDPATQASCCPTGGVQ